MNDKIIISGMTFFGAHGIYEEERRLGQKIVVDLELYLNLQRAGRSDNLADTINYQETYSLVKAICEEKSFYLIEALAEEIAKELLQNFNISSLQVRVKKYHVNLGGLIDFVGVEITRNRQ
ncbi:MAG: dihydroneopterin aldolase [bacterium]|nr:dihydroneopterin aldolase [bacterium]